MSYELWILTSFIFNPQFSINLSALCEKNLLMDVYRVVNFASYLDSR